MEKKDGRGAENKEGISEVGVGKGYVCFLCTYLLVIVVGSYIAGVRGKAGQH